jgi:hypothetical protein
MCYYKYDGDSAESDCKLVLDSELVLLLDCATTGEKQRNEQTNCKRKKLREGEREEKQGNSWGGVRSLEMLLVCCVAMSAVPGGKGRQREPGKRSPTANCMVESTSQKTLSLFVGVGVIGFVFLF